MATQRPSLLDDDAFQKIGNKGDDAEKKKANKARNDMIKIAVSAVALVAAILLLAAQFGAFGSRDSGLPKGTQVREFSEEEIAERERQEQRMIRMKESGRVTEGSS